MPPCGAPNSPAPGVAPPRPPPGPGGGPGPIPIPIPIIPGGAPTPPVSRLSSPASSRFGAGGGSGGVPGGAPPAQPPNASIPKGLPGDIPAPPGLLSGSFPPAPPSVGHPLCGISRGGAAPAPSRSWSARWRSSSESAQQTRAMASVPSRTADSTLGSERRCTARATLSPAANGSSTPTQ